MHPQPPRRSTHVTGSPRSMVVFDRWGEFGRPVLLLHGLLLDRTMWWPAAAELIATASCTVVAPDLPGHGQSPARDDYGVERLARDLAVLVNGLNLHRAPIVVGHAESARLAMAFADAYRTHCVVTLEAPGEPREVPDELRHYAEPRVDRRLLHAYGSWMPQPAMAGASAPTRTGSFLPLTDPAGFAGELRTLL